MLTQSPLLGQIFREKLLVHFFRLFGDFVFLHNFLVLSLAEMYDFHIGFSTEIHHKYINKVYVNGLKSALSLRYSLMQKFHLRRVHSQLIFNFDFVLLSQLFDFTFVALDRLVFILHLLLKVLLTINPLFSQNTNFLLRLLVLFPHVVQDLFFFQLFRCRQL